MFVIFKTSNKDFVLNKLVDDLYDEVRRISEGSEVQRITVNGVTNEIRICEKGERKRYVKVTTVDWKII